MNTQPGDLSLGATLLLVVLSLFSLLTTPAFANEVTWDISFHAEQSYTVTQPIGAGFVVPIPISLDASGTIEVTSPTNVISTVTVPENDIGFSHIFAMPETGRYVIRETYTLVFRSLALVSAVESFTNVDEWGYDNSTPSLMLFRMENMYVYVDEASASITPSDTLEIVDITPSSGRPGDTGQIGIKVLRDIQADETIDVSMTINAKWYKISSLTPVPDNEPPSISHTPVQSIPVGSPIAAKITDNLKVDSAALYFRDASSTQFRPIPMTPASEPDIYEGYISTTAKAGDASYYFKASDPSGNETIFPTSPYNITVLEQIDIHLRQGWNLFSICLQVEDNSVSAVLETVEEPYESVWTSGSWKQYFPDDPDFPGGLEVIVHGKGYWIDMEANDATLTITGVRLADTTIQLEEGWNLVGYNHPEEIDVEDAQLFTPGDNTAIYTYEAGVWKKYHAGGPSSLNDLDRFKPGNGYYIYVTTAREWVISP